MTNRAFTVISIVEEMCLWISVTLYELYSFQLIKVQRLFYYLLIMKIYKHNISDKAINWTTRFGYRARLLLFYIWLYLYNPLLFICCPAFLLFDGARNRHQCTYTDEQTKLYNRYVLVVSKNDYSNANNISLNEFTLSVVECGSFKPVFTFYLE